MTSHGGPVQTSPVVYVDYWGWTGSNPDPDGERAYLENFLSSVGNSNWLKVVTQYGGASANVTYAGSWNDTKSVPKKSPTGKQIAAEAAKADAHWGLTSVNDQVVVALPTGVNLYTASYGACAYHTDTGGVPFTALPYLAAAYAPQTGYYCGKGLVNAGVSDNLDAVGLMEGHELAESITDPIVPTGWTDTHGASGEIADKCEFYNDSDIVTSKGTFAVQPLWSNAANWCSLGYKNGGGSWSKQVEVSGQATSAAPSLTTSGGAVYEAFKGGSSDTVWVIENLGNGWSTNYAVTGASTASSPAVAVLGNRIYVLWTESASPYHIYESSTAALGNSWSTPVIIGNGTAEKLDRPARVLKRIKPLCRLQGELDIGVCLGLQRVSVGHGGEAARRSLELQPCHRMHRRAELRDRVLDEFLR